MLRLPPEFQSTISVFSVLFRNRTWLKARLLLVGAIVCPGSRTVCNVLRTLGLDQEKLYSKFHRVLSRAKWSALKASNLLAQQLIHVFVPMDTPLVFGVDETIERRWGKQIKKRGIYRDAVRSSQSHFVKCSGLRWMSLMLLTSLPWLGRGAFWALPFLTALCPSQKYYDEYTPRQHKKLTDWARQLINWLGRYIKTSDRKVYLTGDGSYATYELMITANEQAIGLIARMKFNSRLFHFPPPRPKGKRGRSPNTGARILGMDKRLTDKRVKWQKVIFEEWYGSKKKAMEITSGVSIWDSNKGYQVPVRWVLVRDPEGELEPTLIATNEIDLDATDIVRFFVRRWRVEVTFAEVRRHLGVETQRQWSDLAIERTTPILMALKSIICLMAKPLYQQGKLLQNNAAWYSKKHYTFSDILLSVRHQLWPKINLPTRTAGGLVGKLKTRIAYLQRTIAWSAA